MECSHQRIQNESSSSEEEDDRLKEALDPSMFNDNTAVKKDVTKSVKSTNYKDNILDVTPEFQSYVGKHLADMIDQNIKERSGKRYEIDSARSGGIKLFAVSSEVLTDDNFCEFSDDKIDRKARKKRKHSKKREDENEVSDEEKIRLAAVSPEWVIEKQGVKGWSKPKGKEIKVKKNGAGELEIVASPFISK